MKAVIFDMDGVLIDSEPMHFEVDKMVLKELKIDESEEYLERFVGYTNPAMWKIIKSDFNIKRSIDELIDLQIGTKLDFLKKNEFFAISGIEKLLKEIKKENIPIAIASSSPRVFIEAVIEKIGIKEYFCSWISGEEVERSKPAPDVFLKMSEILKVKPSNCLVIEDSKSGTISAKSAGMKCVGYKNINSGNQDLSKADLVVSDINDLNLKSIKKLFVNSKNTKGSIEL